MVTKWGIEIEPAPADDLYEQQREADM